MSLSLSLVSIKVIDLLNDFYSYWNKVSSLYIDKQIENDPNSFLGSNIDLFELQKKIYEEERHK